MAHEGTGAGALAALDVMSWERWMHESVFSVAGLTWRRLVACSAILCSVLLSWTPAGGAGAPKIDLRLYGPPLVIGRTTNWEYSDDSWSSTTLLDAGFEANGLLYTFGSSYSDGSSSVTQMLERKNKSYFAGIAVESSGGTGFILWPRDGKPVKLQPSVQKLGKTYNSKPVRGDVIDLESEFVVGRFFRKERCALTGFESISTPAGDYGVTLRQDWSMDTYLDLYYEDDIEIVAYGSYWLVAGEGTVAQTHSTFLYLNGSLSADSGLVNGWRTSVSVP